MHFPEMAGLHPDGREFLLLIGSQERNDLGVDLRMEQRRVAFGLGEGLRGVSDGALVDG